MAHTITRAQYCALVGLVTLARRYDQLLRDCVDAAREITREEDESGHTSDMIWSPDFRSLDEALKLLEITVEPNRPTPETER